MTASAGSRFVAYYRVSTDKQGRSGLGLEAHREAVARHATGCGGSVVAAFEEVESGRKGDRPQLAIAMAECRLRRSTLLIAKLDRLARDAHFLLGLEKAGVEFLAADMPYANRLTIGVMALVAEEEARATSARTKAALAAAKARGAGSATRGSGRGTALPRPTHAQRGRRRHGGERQRCCPTSRQHGGQVPPPSSNSRMRSPLAGCAHPGAGRHGGPGKCDACWTAQVADDTGKDMSEANANRRLSDLLVEPREDLDVEVKGWLDLENSGEHKATLAKALLALANHGGGFVLLGLTETDTGIVPAPNRPPTLDAYSQDAVNGIVQSFAEPPFHCTVQHVAGPSDVLHPIIRVPGGHRVPIRAKRTGPGNAIVQMHAVYIRRPGPKSEVPQSGQEWDDLLGRCLAARRDELLANIRDLLSGAVARPVAAPAEDARLTTWVDTCLARWHALVDGLTANDPRRCPRGHHWFAYEIRGDVRHLPAPEFLETLRRSTVRHTGWSPWWVPTRPGIAPYMKDGVVECWLGRDADRGTDAAHADFWRVSPEGLAFLLRGYDEDGPNAEERGFTPGKVFDITLPVWRVGEALLNAERLASNLGAGEAVLAFRARYEGLSGRELSVLARDRLLFDGRTSHEDSVTLDTIVPVSSVSPNLVEVVHPMLEPLYALFDFFQLPSGLVQGELTKLRSNRY
ncbi:recombinase family protein [Muricoccus pecuniae]|uniref:DNA invertase Pin-like site-specific DNA recombinase n=1 Tax=Muricoccus pecuniae TaxID=693023 RepID=A0A840YAR6_9PROT|nr:recombinase family protein [Roseomonas pecuniae]MBB5695799.1 DNA invertase Pin-like site-specific DNA recombinase [Roseomonas pecuniae]